MKKADFKTMDEEALRKAVTSMRKELFELRLSAASTHIKDNSQFRKLRVGIAQALTCLQRIEK